MANAVHTQTRPEASTAVIPPIERPEAPLRTRTRRRSPTCGDLM
jgi:hypothetical protein